MQFWIASICTFFCSECCCKWLNHEPDNVSAWQGLNHEPNDVSNVKIVEVPDTPLYLEHRALFWPSPLLLRSVSLALSGRNLELDWLWILRGMDWVSLDSRHHENSIE